MLNIINIAIDGFLSINGLAMSIEWVNFASDSKYDIICVWIFLSLHGWGVCHLQKANQGQPMCSGFRRSWHYSKGMGIDRFYRV